MPKLVIVRYIGSLPGESHYEVHTPMGTWQVDMVKYSAGSYEGSGYGTAPRWMVTTPGEDRPDSAFDRKRDAVAYITAIVDEELDKNGGDAVQIAVKAHQEDELHADGSPWAKVAEQHTAPASQETAAIKEADTVTETAPQADTDEYAPSRDAAIAAARIALTELKTKDWKTNPVYWVGRLEAALEQTLKAIDKDEANEAARHGETVKLNRATCDDQTPRKRPDLRTLANPKKADPETIDEIHASRCIECKGAGCPSCGYKGVARTVCPAHHVVDKRGGRAVELGAIPACESGITYGAWSEGAGGFVYSGDCATEVANWAADELRQLAKDDDTDTIQILAMCPDHDEQPKNGCEECGSEGDDEAEQDPEPSLDDYAKASRIIQNLIPRGRRQ